jgi:hypothetical protein
MFRRPVPIRDKLPFFVAFRTSSESEIEPKLSEFSTIAENQ